MRTLKVEYDWVRTLLPEGLPYPSSTLISGPGGTGKPLVEFAFVASWLKSGGSAISMPLQYPNMELVKTAMNNLYDMDLDDYHGTTAYLQFAPHIDEYERATDNIIKANLLKPAVWDSAIERAETMVERTALGTLVFGSALNLLLFSPTYADETIGHVYDILRNDKDRTYLFSVSTSAFADKIQEWESVADNLMFTRMEKPMKLFSKVTRAKGVDFSTEEVQVPISKDMLMNIKEVAEGTRKRMIPDLRAI